MAAMRVGGDAGSEEAVARLGQFEELERVLNDRDAARSDLAAAQATLDRVEQEAARLCQATGYERAGRPADAVAETLFDRLAEAKELAQRRKTLDDLIREATKAGLQADSAVRQAGEELSQLKAAAGCETLEALLAAEHRSAEAQRLEAEVAAIEARLVLASALPLRDLLAQAEGQDLALVKAALERASGDLEAFTTQVEALHARLIEAQAGLDRVDGAAAAAAAEQRAADAAARLSHRVADYASARLASAILAEVIETYQQRHQGPLLARASELFATITGGRFAKVATDFDEAMTILVAVRPNGQRVTVGNLSSGTRDQLFLALRLAAIESHVRYQGAHAGRGGRHRHQFRRCLDKRHLPGAGGPVPDPPRGVGARAGGEKSRRASRRNRAGSLRSGRVFDGWSDRPAPGPGGRNSNCETRPDRDLAGTTVQGRPCRTDRIG